MQNGVTLSTKENELEVVYGPYNSSYNDDDRVLALASLKFILTDMNDIRKRYISLGFHLSEFRRCGHFFKFGYATMEGFCAANLGMDKSAISRCISVWENFAAVDDGHSRKMWLDEKYKEYSYSQLCEMVSMDDVQRSQVKPDMTIKQIREIKKNKSTLSDSLDELDKIINVSPVATSQLLSYKEYCDSPLNKRIKLIKECDAKDNVCIDVYDKNGKHVYGNFWCDLICTQDGHYMFRLNFSEE